MKRKFYEGIKFILEALQKLIFPSSCWHCQQLVENIGKPFCQGCQNLLELLSAHERCPRCFACGYDTKYRSCKECRDRPFFLVSAGAAFDYQGPAKAIVGKLKRHEWPKTAQGAAGYMVAQMLKLGWPIPDVVVPVPISQGRKCFRGHNQAELLARGVGTILNRPVLDCLWRPTDVPKTCLSRHARLQPNSRPMKLKRGGAIREGVVLLVDDVFTTGSTFQESAQALLAGFPKSIYAMALCRSSVPL